VNSANDRIVERVPYSFRDNRLESAGKEQEPGKHEASKGAVFRQRTNELIEECRSFSAIGSEFK
jgi:hypothetical protein